MTEADKMRSPTLGRFCRLSNLQAGYAMASNLQNPNRQTSFALGKESCHPTSPFKILKEICELDVGISDESELEKRTPWVLGNNPKVCWVFKHVFTVYI